jgi:hypothetical protein
MAFLRKKKLKTQSKALRAQTFLLTLRAESAFFNKDTDKTSQNRHQTGLKLLNNTI